MKFFKILDIQLLGADVYRVRLHSDEGFVPEYYAGQYLEILLSENEACAFSIASAPSIQQKALELHIQKISGKENSRKLFQALQGNTITVRMAKGSCYIDKVINRPLLLIAAGTGFAQMKSIIEHSLNQNHRDIHLYWGAKTPNDFYLPSLPVQWAEQKIKYHPVISDATHESDWCGRFGLLYEAILTDKEKLINAEVYISGSPSMVYTTLDAMVDSGFNQDQIHSDVFDYAPR